MLLSMIGRFFNPSFTGTTEREVMKEVKYVQVKNDNIMPKHLFFIILFGSLALWSSCKDEETNPLQFYQDNYEVSMGAKRYIGLQSGNGDYSLEIEDQRVASAGVEHGWSVIGGSMIYVQGILTGKTRLKVTDNATMESHILNIKVVDSYECLRLHRGDDSDLIQRAEDLLPGIDYIYLVNTPERKAYFFKQGEQTASSSGLKLVTEGTYNLEEDAEEGMREEKAFLTLFYSEDAATPLYAHPFILHGNKYILHRLNKNLNLGWKTEPVGTNRTSTETNRTSIVKNRTSIVPPPSYLLEEKTSEGEGRKISFSFEPLEMPEGILP